MKLSVTEIAKIIQAEIIGDPSFIISGVSSFDDSDMHDITFAYDIKYLANLQHTKAGAVIIPNTFIPDSYHCENTILLKTNSIRPRTCYYSNRLSCRIYAAFKFSK